MKTWIYLNSYGRGESSAREFGLQSKVTDM